MEFPQLQPFPDPSAIRSDDARVQLERFPAAEDSDTATKQTIELMCRYIRESADDPVIQAAAQWAWSHFGGNSEDPGMKAWAVFWFVKHNVKFVVDEAPMFRLGEPNQQDLLISPSVLIRMEKPAEDCDGFTMLGAALLKVLDVPFTIATIAASPDDPERWSHVFLMAMLPTGPLPLDASHGSGPGWIVPASHTFRWQCWDCDGRQVDVQRPRKHSLNGYVRRGMGMLGLGQDDGSEPSPGDLTPLPPVMAPVSILAPVVATPSTSGGAGYTLPSSDFGYVSTTPATPTPAASAPFNLQSFLTNLTNVAGQTTQAYVKAQTAQQLAQEGAYTASNILGTLMPIAIGIGAIWLISSFVGNKK